MFRAVTKAVLASPPTVRTVVILVAILMGWLGANWTYHAFNKPSEVLFPLDRSLNKSPAETWKQYGSLFREHATAVITPELLAALAQVEGGGNPVARTYWRWHLSWNPLEWYQPASSAVGMYQITDGTFSEATRYCIHDHMVVEDGPWHDPQSCWFNSLYQRVVPSHAIELTAAGLDRRVAQAMGTRQIGRGHSPAKAGPGCRHSPLWSRSRPCLCRTRLSTGSPPTMRRPRRASLPLTGQCNEAAVRPTGVQRQTTSARQPSLTTIALTTRMRRIFSSHRPLDWSLTAPGRGPSDFSRFYLRGAARLSFPARIEGAHSDRAASASKKDGLAVPRPTLLSVRVARAQETNRLPSHTPFRTRLPTLLGWPGRSSIARVERAPSERARSASRRTTRLPCLPSIRRTSSPPP